MSGLWHQSQSDAPTKNRQGCDNCKVDVGKLMRAPYSNYFMKIDNGKFETSTGAQVNCEGLLPAGKLIRAL